MRQFMRGVALLVAIVCAVAFFSVGNESGGANGRQTSRMYVGQPWPWFESRMEQEVRPDGSASSSADSGVRRSPAWLVFGFGVLGLIAFHQLRAPVQRPLVA